MSDDEARGKGRRSARLPATLLLIMVVLISGSVLWLTSEPTPEKPAPPTADITLAPSGGHKPDDGATPAPTKAPPAVVPPAARPEKSAPPAPADKQPESPAAEETAHQPADHATPPPETSPQTSPKTPPAQPPRPAAAPSAVPDRAPSGDHAEKAPAASPPSTESAPAEHAAQEKPALPADAAATKKEAPVASTVVPPITPVVPKLPRVVRSAPLTAAPDPALIEETPQGRLPIVGRDGREAWRVYARPFDRNDKRPRIAVVIYGLGTSAAATQSAIQGLPGAITLAFTPYSDELPGWIGAARAAGHEVLLMVPMEPENYPDFDPGPQALLTSLSEKENTDRLEWMLGRGVGYVGVTDFMGSRFTNSGRHMRAFFSHLKKRGLLFLESRTSASAVTSEIAAAANIPFAANMLFIDGKASRDAIDNQLREAERLAKRLGSAAIMGFSYPVTLERVADWAMTVEKRGFALAPVSALATRKEP